MSEPLPMGEFQWLSDDEINSLDIRSIRPDSKEGYILEVDLEYPRELHDSHNAYRRNGCRLTSSSFCG